MPVPLYYIILYVYYIVCFVSCPQVHTLQGETVQVPGMRQRVLPVAHAGRAQDPAPGGVAAQVSGVQSQLQPAVQPEDAPADAHRHQAVQLSHVQQSVPPELRPAPAQPHAQPAVRARNHDVRDDDRDRGHDGTTRRDDRVAQQRRRRGLQRGECS